MSLNATERPPNRFCALGAAVTGISGALLALLLPVAGDIATPGYDPLRQYISELGAKGAVNAEWVNYLGFLPAGVLLTVFCGLGWLASPLRRWPETLGFLGIALYATGYITATFYPCAAGCELESDDASQMIHNLIGIAGYLVAPGALACLSLGVKPWPNSLSLGLTGWFCAAITLVGLTLLVSDPTYKGLWQRILEAGTLVWVLVCGLYFARQYSKAKPQAF